MEPTRDGFVHQSRQDDLFQELEVFADSVYVCLVLTALQRELTLEEIHLLQKAGNLNAIMRPPRMA